MKKILTYMVLITIINVFPLTVFALIFWVSVERVLLHIFSESYWGLGVLWICYGILAIVYTWIQFDMDEPTE